MLQSLRLSPRSMSRRCLSTRRSDPTTSSALRTAVQIAEAPSVEPRPHPGAVSKEVGFTTRLSDGRGQLRQDSIRVGEGDWPRPKKEGSEASGQEGRRRVKPSTMDSLVPLPRLRREVPRLILVLLQLIRL